MNEEVIKLRFPYTNERTDNGMKITYRRDQADPILKENDEVIFGIPGHNVQGFVISAEYRDHAVRSDGNGLTKEESIDALGIIEIRIPKLNESISN